MIERRGNKKRHNQPQLTVIVLVCTRPLIDAAQLPWCWAISRCARAQPPFPPARCPLSPEWKQSQNLRFFLYQRNLNFLTQAVKSFGSSRLTPPPDLAASRLSCSCIGESTGYEGIDIHLGSCYMLSVKDNSRDRWSNCATTGVERNGNRLTPPLVGSVCCPHAPTRALTSDTGSFGGQVGTRKGVHHHQYHLARCHPHTHGSTGRARRRHVLGLQGCSRNVLEYGAIKIGSVHKRSLHYSL